MTTVESALSDHRIEYAQEPSEGTFPTDPSWEVLTDYLDELTFTPGAGREAISVVGQGDVKDMFRGAEEPEVSTNYYKQQGFVDSGGGVNYPGGRPLTYDYSCDLQSFNIVVRRETDCNGNFDAGFREYIVIRGAKPTEVSNPGDAANSQPIIEQLTWAVQQGRSYVIHQPDSSTTLDITNGGDADVDVTIEDESAATSETITVAANSTVTTVESYSDVDVIFAESDHDGDITVTDGSGTNVLDETTPLAGSNTDGVESDRGVTPLGSGSHGSAVGTDPTDYQFLGVDQINWQGSALADRIHSLDFTVSLETDRNAVTGTRRQTIDIGTRTVEVEAETSGPFESATRIAQQYHNESSDFVYSYPDNDVTIKNAEITDADDYTRTAGDTNSIPSTTFQGKTDSDASAVSVTYTGA